MRRSCTIILLFCAHEHMVHDMHMHTVDLARISRVDAPFCAHLCSFCFSPNGTG